MSNKKLQEYFKKRNFDKTPEPKGSFKVVNEKPIFVIQKHDASNLHYDFRLEHDGVLLSWAVPKGPSLNPSNRRLAIMTEDHPLEYADFEGTIPEEEYGGGEVIVWDLGVYKNVTEKDGTEYSMEQALENGYIMIDLEGEKLVGTFVLVKTGDDDRWLLIKKKDDYADYDIDILKEKPDSVLSDKKL
ncbi:MAG: DNA polymerase ligase N-terminal domain-containing protein [Clostridia bacterium]